MIPASGTTLPMYLTQTILWVYATGLLQGYGKSYECPSSRDATLESIGKLITGIRLCNKISITKLRIHFMWYSVHNLFYVTSAISLGHWEPRVVMMPTLSSLLAPQFVVTTTCGASSDDKVWHHKISRFSMVRSRGLKIVNWISLNKCNLKWSNINLMAAGIPSGYNSSVPRRTPRVSHRAAIYFKCYDFNVWRTKHNRLVRLKKLNAIRVQPMSKWPRIIQWYLMGIYKREF